MFCSNCGKEIHNGEKFCHYCGAVQGEVHKAASTAQKPKSKGKKTLGIVMMVLGGLAVIGSIANGSCSAADCDMVSIVSNAVTIGLILWGLVLWSENSD